jgi:hypothetical protein
MICAADSHKRSDADANSSKSHQNVHAKATDQFRSYFPKADIQARI